MIYSLIFAVTGRLDGTTLVNLPLPEPDGMGIYQMPSVAQLGGIDPAMLVPLVGPGGYLLCGVGINVYGGAGYDLRVGLVGRSAPSVFQMIPALSTHFNQPQQPPYVERPCYVPPQYRLCFALDNEGGTANLIRLDIAPTRTTKQAVQAMRITRPSLLTPGAFP